MNQKKVSFSDQLKLLINNLPFFVKYSGGLYIFTKKMIYASLYFGLVGVKNFLAELLKTKVELDKTFDYEVNFNNLNNKGYIIHAPNFVSNSAGIKCLYQLCHDLNQRGYTSLMTGTAITDESLQAPIITHTFAEKICTDKFIAVYPEIVVGNPLKAKNVARWALNKPGLLGGDSIYDSSEKVFYYANVYLSSIKNEVSGKLYLPTIDESIFYSDDLTNERPLECYYVGKSTYKAGYFDPNKTFEITRNSPNKKELGKLFRACKVLYCFDNSTILVYEAILCGCPVVIIPDGTQTKEDYLKSELGIDGIAWGIEELSKARANVSLLKERYDETKKQYLEQLEEFIKITQT